MSNCCLYYFLSNYFTFDGWLEALRSVFFTVSGFKVLYAHFLRIPSRNLRALKNGPRSKQIGPNYLENGHLRFLTRHRI